MKMLNAVTSMGHLPHTKLDNQQTHYDSVRLVQCFNEKDNFAIFWKFLSN